MADIRYITGGADGWLNVKREPAQNIIALPGTLKVDVTSNKNGRDYFTASEGVEKGKNFSVKEGYLSRVSPNYRSAASLSFSVSNEILEYPYGKIHAFTDDINPIPVGIHNIQIPDFPHDGGLGYTVQSPFAKNWFYLGTGNAVPGNNDRYLHPGRGTLGCITVDPTKWTELYEYLIRCRSGDGKTVGRVTVTR
ncbi:TPA: hypothetical protein PC598_004368 [Morganella morganii]|uniref:hypothetical protein n=1 Tax=Morganella morganii TaxID=582 RepID=UPI0013B35E65|nr:hypothetical protein [Morganella morganii]HDF2341562.1 hypothetical protein [Morganella morganii]HDF2344680.1 hypothetical protein [Morganella morganii]